MLVVDGSKADVPVARAVGAPYISFGRERFSVGVQMLFRQRDYLAVQAHEHLRHVAEQIFEQLELQRGMALAELVEGSIDSA